MSKLPAAPGPLLHRHPEELGVVGGEVEQAEPVDRMGGKGAAVALERTVLQPPADPAHVPRQHTRKLVGRREETFVDCEALELYAEPAAVPELLHREERSLQPQVRYNTAPKVRQSARSIAA